MDDLDPADRPDPSSTDLRAWHELLLRLAGLLPDDLIGETRSWLAEGAQVDVAQTLAFALADARVPVLGPEADLLAAELHRAGEDTFAVEALSRVDPTSVPPPTWLFSPSGLEYEGPEDLADAPLDLTQGPPPGDPLDRAAIHAGAAHPRLVSLWRAWRWSPDPAGTDAPRRVFVARADDRARGADLVAVTVLLQAALAAAGETDPQVEVLAADSAPQYATAAIRGAALLWAREPVAPIELARVFDLVDPVTGPEFDPDHPRLSDPAEIERLLDCLNSGVPVLPSDATMPDLLDPLRPAVVPLSFRTDGAWVWTDTIAYYLQEHALAPEPDLLAHLTGRSPGPIELSEVTRHRALSFLYRSQDTEPVWSVSADGFEPVPVGRTDGGERR